MKQRPSQVEKRREPPEAIPFPWTQNCNLHAENGMSEFQ